MSYLLHLLVYLEIYTILALGLNLIIGYCGLYSLAHSAFFAIGAYVYAVLATYHGFGFVPAAAAAAVIGGIASLGLSLPAWRLRGDYFLMVSVAAQVGIFGIIYNWYRLGADEGTWFNLTNGPYGIAGVPPPRFLDLEVAAPGLALTGLVCLAAIGATLYRLNRSPWGRMLRAMRDNELALRALGKNVRMIKAQALAIACATAAIAGALYASYAGYVDPAICSVEESVLLMGAVVIGGAGTLRGAVAGAVLLVLLPEALRALALPDVVAANIRLGAFGLLMVLAVRFRPAGLFGRPVVR